MKQAKLKIGTQLSARSAGKHSLEFCVSFLFQKKRKSNGAFGTANVLAIVTDEEGFCLLRLCLCSVIRVDWRKQILPPLWDM